MTSTSPRPVPEYQRFRPIFAIIVGVVWFVLLLGFGLLIALQLPGDEMLPFRLAWRFFLVGFFPICLFAAPATFIGFLQQYLAGAFLPPSVSTASEPPEGHSLNPWDLGLHRLVLWWLPAVLLATIVLWLVFPVKIGRGMLAFVLALLGAPLASGMALASSGKLFLREIQRTPQQRTWRDSFFSYLVWRHGIPWGIGNGVINAAIALALFPRTVDGIYGIMPSTVVSVDIFLTALVLSGFMALSAHPHAWVDIRLGVVSAYRGARSPARSGRVAWFVGSSLGAAVLTFAVLHGIGSIGMTLGEFVVWKGLATTLIAGAAAMVTAHWTLAREALAVTIAEPQEESHAS